MSEQFVPTSCCYLSITFVTSFESSSPKTVNATLQKSHYKNYSIFPEVWPSQSKGIQVVSKLTATF